MIDSWLVLVAMKQKEKIKQASYYAQTLIAGNAFKSSLNN